MSLIGSCDDCGAGGVQLRYKPDVPHENQTRPSICQRCRDERAHMLEEQGQQNERPVSPHAAPPWAEMEGSE
ncbi:hypothetical protein [Halobacterium bonnevillei]|uniref:Uncharacterized protein n=1 Tax=Halobacterium bonnevillei TaxID=2692200 RepID=A0A6B0SSX1_9EURY|nr:hypothetical protein [Halobacterium bonnevillei]MXR22132.1 hypothetical protein [Halobacterium bonnevillei]